MGEKQISILDDLKVEKLRKWFWMLFLNMLPQLKQSWLKRRPDWQKWTENKKNAGKKKRKRRQNSKNNNKMVMTTELSKSPMQKLKNSKSKSESDAKENSVKTEE